MTTPEPNTMVSWRVSLLGNLEAHAPSGQLVAFPGRYLEGLFGLLCLAPGTPQDRDSLAERLWPSLELASKRTRLRQELAQLKRIVGTDDEEGLLVLERSTVSIATTRVTTDLAQFEALVRAGDTESLRRAVGLYRGDLLERHEELASGKRLEMAELYESTLAALAARERTAGHYDEARVLLQKLLGRDALNLAAHSELMRLYAQQGQPEGVHRQWQKAETSWRETLHTTPPEALSALAHELQRTSTLPQAPPSTTPPPAPPSLPLSAPPTPTPPTTAKPPRRRFIWFGPLVLALLGGVGAYLRLRPNPAVPIPAKVLWQHGILPSSPEERPNSEGLAAAASPDGTLCVVGQVETLRDDTDILTVFIRPNGQLLPTRRYASDSHECDRAFSVTALPEGGFVIAGHSYLPDAPGRQEGWHLVVLKYDSNGQKLWQHTSDERISDIKRLQVVPDGQGGVYVAATAVVGPTENTEKPHPLLLRYSAKGKPLWSRTLLTAKTEATFGALCADTRGNAYLGATQSKEGSPSDWLVASYDLAGTLRWQESVDGEFRGKDTLEGIAISRFGTLFVGGVQQHSTDTSQIALARFTDTGKLLGVHPNLHYCAEVALTSLSLSENGLRVALAGEFTTHEGVIDIECAVFDEAGNTRWKVKPPLPAPHRSNAAPRVFIDRYGGVVLASQLSRGTRLAPAIGDDYLLSRYGPDGTLRETQLYQSAEDAQDELTALAMLPDSSPVLIGQRSGTGFAQLQAVKLDSPAHP